MLADEAQVSSNNDEAQTLPTTNRVLHILAFLTFYEFPAYLPFSRKTGKKRPNLFWADWIFFGCWHMQEAAQKTLNDDNFKDTITFGIGHGYGPVST